MGGQNPPEEPVGRLSSRLSPRMEGKPRGTITKGREVSSYLFVTLFNLLFIIVIFNPHSGHFFPLIFRQSGREGGTGGERLREKH